MLLLQRAFALGRAAAHLRLVHHVVVVQRRQVHQLDDGARDGDLPRVGFGAQPRRQHREQRAEPLAAGLEQVLDGLGHQLVGFAQLSGHQVLDAGHAVADILREGGVSEIHPRHHARWCPHPANILGSMDTRADVVVVGAGPAGSAAAAWACRAGRDVLVIDSAQFPRDKACGDGLTPRAVAGDASGSGSARGSTAGRAPRAADVGVRRRRRSRVAGPVVPGDSAARCPAPSSTTASAWSPSTTARR